MNSATCVVCCLAWLHTLQFGDETEIWPLLLAVLRNFIPRVSDYLDRLSLYFEMNSVAQDKQVPVLLTTSGRETYALLTNLVSPDKPREMSLADLVAILKKQFEPQPVIIAERFQFHRQQQEANETTAEYVAELRRLATTCEQQALRDRVVCGLRHEPSRMKLLTESKLTLNEAIEIAQSVEAAERNSQRMNAEGQQVNRVAQKGQQRVSREKSQTGCYRRYRVLGKGLLL